MHTASYVRYTLEKYVARYLVEFHIIQHLDGGVWFLVMGFPFYSSFSTTVLLVAVEERTQTCNLLY